MKLSLTLSILLLLFAGGVVAEEAGNVVKFLPYDENNPECLLYGIGKDEQRKTISNAPKALSQLNEMRSRAFNHCLSCIDDSCNLKSWNEANSKNTLICNRLFCRATYQSKKVNRVARMKLSEGYGNLLFSFSINKQGLVDAHKITYLDGTIKRESVEIFLEKLLTGHKFEPIVIDNQAYALKDLKGRAGLLIITP
ncbi:MAG: hypothetical protein ACJ0F4_00585 [Gammaproteobacteria bacterium]